jgi:beta-lactamase superfamily II metal-dependent hydrolase
MPDTIRFAGYPSAQLYALGTGTEPPAKLKALKHLLWGDELVVKGSSSDGKFLRVFTRKMQGWIKTEATQLNRLLEIVFVDIGQGDGALIITPDAKRYILDAGAGDNMYRFLRWRFGFKTTTVFDAAFISHSDADHYGGFAELFADPQVHINTLYTNGLMERAATTPSESLGKPKLVKDKKFITQLVSNNAELAKFFAKPKNWENKNYPTLLQKAFAANSFDDYRMLDSRAKHLPGYEADKELRIDVLGPVVETVSRKPSLRWFGDVGKTKNGHSISLRFTFKNLSLFMGGDLNIESSRLLLEAHTGLSGTPSNAEEERLLVEAARPHFECDVAKACHHGSADTLLAFVKALNPIATIISSGDDEPYAHPRADALGAIAKHSRDDRPLLLSTELARSAKDVIKHPAALRKQLSELAANIANATTEQARTAAQAKFDALVAKIDRSIAVYGAINLRSDGEKVVLAYKLERSMPSNGWDICQLEAAGNNGKLVYKSKYD